ncbi:acyl-CoA N-acyltransferase [Cytidiella melzeri]|nr:acyl-CoA N-acyltransferase [Cytidiella melzeri]
MSTSPAKKEFFIRPAQADDVDAILKLIVDLATYEKATDSVKATPELLRKNLFEKEYAHTLLAFLGTTETPGDAVGMALYFHNFSTWTGKPGVYLEDLYVTPECRSMGIGKALFAELGKIAEDNDCARLDWSVLKWNQPSIDFYDKALGATSMSEWMGMRLEGAGIQNLRKFAPPAGPAPQSIQ